MAKNPLSTILDTNKLTGPNYSDWLRNLKIVLNSENRAYVLTDAPLSTLPEGAEEEEIETHKKWLNDDLQARCTMLASMSNEL